MWGLDRKGSSRDTCHHRFISKRRQVAYVRGYSLVHWPGNFRKGGKRRWGSLCNSRKFIRSEGKGKKKFAINRASAWLFFIRVCYQTVWFNIILGGSSRREGKKRCLKFKPLSSHVERGKKDRKEVGG